MKRFIRYLYEYEENQKKRNVGFVKVEQDGKEATISVHGKGLCGKSNENISCYLIKMDSETGNVFLIPAGEMRIGMPSCGGCFCYTEDMVRPGSEKTGQNVGQSCEMKDGICGLGLGNPNGPFYVALWNEEMYGNLDITKVSVGIEMHGETQAEINHVDQAGAGQKTNSDKVSGKTQKIDKKEEVVEPQNSDYEEKDNVEAEPQENESRVMAEEPRENESRATTEESQENEDRIMSEEPRKAESQTMPAEPRENESRAMTEESQENEDRIMSEESQKSPQRQIMKIQRGEISILPRCEWKLANNNFLLHGYYNYRHLVLIDEGDKLKLGVPGIYHEREARAAATFGFPEFIAEADVKVTLEPQERNENQPFGYWCRQVRRPPR